SDFDRCQNEKNVDMRIGGCSAVIASNAPQNRASAFYYRGWGYNDKAQYEQALTDLGGAIALNATSADNFTERGYSYLKLKRYALAIQDYNQSLLLRPNHVNTLVERGIANFAANQYAAARLDFEAVIR